MSVKRRGGQADANYFYRFKYKGLDHCQGGFRTSAQATEAERLAKDLAIKQIQHPEDYAGEMTVRQAGEWWLKDYAITKVSAQKIDLCRMPLIMNYFDKKLLREVTPADVDLFLSRLHELRNAVPGNNRIYRISSYTRNHYRTLFHALYSRLKKKRMYRGENPVEFVDKIQIPLARVRFIYPAEEKILTPAILAADRDLFDYYFLGINTGLRISEMMNIKVKHVDLVLKHIFMPEPKNHKSRYVPFEGALEAVLAHHLVGKDAEAFLMPRWGYNCIRERFYAVCRKVGIKNLHIHDWRHTFAYNCLSQGEAIYKVSKLMGHSSVTVTESHYGHLAAKDLRDTIERVKPFVSCNRFATDTDYGSALLSEIASNTKHDSKSKIDQN